MKIERTEMETKTEMFEWKLRVLAPVGQLYPNDASALYASVGPAQTPISKDLGLY